MQSTNQAERPAEERVLPERRVLPEKYRGWRFDPVLDLVWFVGKLQVRGEYRAQVDRAHGQGLALEERIEQHFNRLTGADGPL